MAARVNPDLISPGCPDLSQPCGHPSFWQTATLLEGLGVVVLVVVLGLAVAWTWRQRTYREAARESRAAADERRRHAKEPEGRRS